MGGRAFEPVAPDWNHLKFSGKMAHERGAFMRYKQIDFRPLEMLAYGNHGRPRKHHISKMIKTNKKNAVDALLINPSAFSRTEDGKQSADYIKERSQYALPETFIGIARCHNPFRQKNIV